ncbi:DUF1624 domain-containing protein [Spirosoma rigui]|uniref:DUF1624 domain-containing protein n=1 Tax=Spirosoma rigui TaxID=564064 RepID=UPI0009B12425|nr:heparan-alpha-glucosaminide N-acetyltransferase domain-containing protein [Spirosoma rigui]
MKRINTVDIVRGIVMVIMALDHTRDLLHIPALTQDPTDLATTTAPIFLTRWITHLCAPTFVFLSGTSAYLSLLRRSDRPGGLADARSFLRKRGLVLILLEITVINFAFWTDIQFRSLMLQVIFAIGGGLVLLSWLSKISARWLGGIGLLIIGLHGLLALLPAFTNPAVRLGWALLFRTEVFPISANFILLVAYPLIPWFGIMLVGFACGPVFVLPPEQRRKRFVYYGLLSLGVFVIVRAINVYGSAPWSVQKDPLFTLLSFINVNKYPPSLLYTAVTLGVMFVMLWLADGADNAFTRVMTVYGKVPLFYYILHWYLVKAAMTAMVLLQGFRLSDMPLGSLSFGRPPGSGLSLLGVYAVWLGIVVVLYPLCRWYGRYKADHPHIGWLRYV